MASDELAALATRLMTEGGDARLHLDPATGLNRYHSAPRPADVLAFASSTANDISADAFAQVQRVLAEIGAEPSPLVYAERLEELRGRIRSAYAIPEDVDVVFAPSGTDLEYVALACIGEEAGVHNVLLGADEVGSGCIHSAHGRYFAEETALGVTTRPGEPVPGLGGTRVDMIDVPVRDAAGYGRHSFDIAAAIDATLVAKGARRALVHVVHGSKTGLILPHLAELDALQAKHGGALTFVVDACQARITSSAVRDYLARDAIVFVTGSKFMGGPPFSGFALVPTGLAARAPSLPSGLATVFRRAEWPEGWRSREQLPDTSNVGLLLRLEASIFELERFQALDPAAVERVVLAFHAAVRREIVEALGVRRVAPYPKGEREEADTHPIEMRTLSTLDLTALGGATFEQAQGWHKALLRHGVRLGQPVKCVRLPDGSWGATLRVGLSMPQVFERAGFGDQELATEFGKDMKQVADALASVSRGT